MKRNAQSGFSLVSVLMIMGIIVLSIGIISQSRSQKQKIQQVLKAKNSYTEVLQSLAAHLAGAMHGRLAGGLPCLDLNAFLFNYNAGALVNPSLPSYRYTTAITAQSDWPVTHQRAAMRCANPLLPNNASNPTQNQIYYCIQLGRDANAARSTIYQAELAFAEVSVDLIHLQNRQAISCSDYVTRRNDPRDGAAGMIMLIALYWQNQIQGVKQFSQRAYSYVANQN